MDLSGSEVDGVVVGAATLRGEKLAGLYVILRFWVLLAIKQGRVLRGLLLGDEVDDDDDTATIAEVAEVESNNAINIEFCLSQFNPLIL